MSPPERQIVEQIRQGNEAAFEELFRSHSEGLCRFAESYVRGPEVAEDLVHEVFCDVWDRRVELGSTSSVKSYLYGAVRNKSLNWLKHRRVRLDYEAQKKREESAVAESAATATELSELERTVSDAIRDLSDRQRHVYLLARQQDLTYAEIANILGISRKSVENHMGRALKALRESLTAYFPISD